MMEIYELTDAENLVLELAQEFDAEGISLLNADDVVRYAWKEYDQVWSKTKATRALSSVTRLGYLIRQRRSSRGWGLGWYAAEYSLAPHARIRNEHPR